MLVFQFQHYVKEELRDQYLSILVENIHESVKEKGFLRFDLLRDKPDPSHFILIEVYKDQGARDFHLETEHFLKFLHFVRGNDIFVKKGIGHVLDPVYLSIADR